MTTHGKQVPYIHTAMFCVWRLILAYTTVFWSDHIIVNILTSFLFSLSFMYYYICYMPMKSKSFNYIEVTNSFFILIGSYFMIIFSDWVQDIQLRYHLGLVFVYITIFIVTLNFILIFRELIHHVILRWR